MIQLIEIVQPECCLLIVLMIQLTGSHSVRGQLKKQMDVYKAWTGVEGFFVQLLRSGTAVSLKVRFNIVGGPRMFQPLVFLP